MLSHKTLDRALQNVNANRNISKLTNGMPPSLIIRMVSVDVNHRVSKLTNRMPPSLIIRMVSVDVKHRVSKLNNGMPPSLISRMWLSWKLSNMNLKLNSGHPWRHLFIFFFKCCFTSTDYGLCSYGLLGTGGAQDGHLDFHTAPELCHHSPQVGSVA